MSEKEFPYERPAIKGRRQFETQAIGCAKTPGIGSGNYCGAVWSGRSGQGKPGCTMNPATVSRSS